MPTSRIAGLKGMCTSYFDNYGQIAFQGRLYQFIVQAQSIRIVYFSTGSWGIFFTSFMKKEKRNNRRKTKIEV